MATSENRAPLAVSTAPATTDRASSTTARPTRKAARTHHGCRRPADQGRGTAHGDHDGRASRAASDAEDHPERESAPRFARQVRSGPARHAPTEQHVQAGTGQQQRRQPADDHRCSGHGHRDADEEVAQDGKRRIHPDDERRDRQCDASTSARPWRVHTQRRTHDCADDRDGGERDGADGQHRTGDQAEHRGTGASRRDLRDHPLDEFRGRHRHRRRR